MPTSNILHDNGSERCDFPRPTECSLSQLLIDEGTCQNRRVELVVDYTSLNQTKAETTGVTGNTNQVLFWISSYIHSPNRIMLQMAQTGRGINCEIIVLPTLSVCFFNHNIHMTSAGQSNEIHWFLYYSQAPGSTFWPSPSGLVTSPPTAEPPPDGTIINH